MPDPNTGKTEKNLPLAKQTIDLLGLLREKTRNNLDQEEENLFEHLLYDLRMSLRQGGGLIKGVGGEGPAAVPGQGQPLSAGCWDGGPTVTMTW